MKSTFYVAALLLGLWSCNSQTSNRTADTKATPSADTIKINVTSTAKPQEKIYIKDKSLYDPAFIAKLAEHPEQSKSLKLIDNYVLADQDTIYFPEEVPLNKETVFKGTKNKRNFVLTVTRINLTSLNYNFQLFEEGYNMINKTGKVTLGWFFLGSESDEDDETGDGYPSAEYRDDSADCSFAIRIGDREGYEWLRANVNLYCKEKIKTIELEDCPTLRTSRKAEF